MRLSQPMVRELSLAVKFAAACLAGFLADLLAFRIGLGLGLAPPLARLIALGAALQVSFVLSRWVVFRGKGRGPLAGEWWRYMVANGSGGLCSFWLFVSLVALNQPVISGPWIALMLSSSVAFVVNYAGTRLFVYGRDFRRPRGAPVAVPSAPNRAPEP